MSYVEQSSAKNSLVNMDNRSKEARFLKDMRQKIRNHLGEVDVSFPIGEIIDRASWLALCVTQAEKRIAQGDVSGDSIDQYTQLCGAYADMLGRLRS